MKRKESGRTRRGAHDGRFMRDLKVKEKRKQDEENVKETDEEFLLFEGEGGILREGDGVLREERCGHCRSNDHGDVGIMNGADFFFVDDSIDK